MLSDFKFKPSVIVLQPDEVAQQTASGLYLSQDKFRSVIRTGRVVVSNDEAYPVGAVVHHEPYAYKEIEIDDITYRVIEKDAIIAVQVDNKD